MYWQDQLHQTMNRLRKADPTPRIAVMGVGNALRGDDMVGILVGRALQQQVRKCPGLYVIEAGSVPENHCGELRRIWPALVLVVDAAQMKAEPGSVRWYGMESIAGLTTSTHTLPLYLFGYYLKAELGCEVVVLGIQPEDTAFGAPLSLPVRKALPLVVSGLLDVFAGVSKDAGMRNFDVFGRETDKNTANSLEMDGMYL